MCNALGLACYIAWSFLFWNGPLLMVGSLSVTAADGAFIAQGIATVLASGLLALIVCRNSRRFSRTVLFAIFSGLSLVSVATLALYGAGVPSQILIVAFALSGMGSTLRLLWEERISFGGVRRVALTVSLAYAIGYAIFATVAFFPSEVVAAATAALTFAGMGCFAIGNRRPRSSSPSVPSQGSPSQNAEKAVHGLQHPENIGLRELARQLPIRHLIIVALAFFGYGAMRTVGIFGGYQAGSAIPSALSAGIPALSSMVAVFVAYRLYKRKATLTFYVAFPLMVFATLLPSGVDMFSGAVAFCIMLVGSEVVKYVVWFMLIDSIAQDSVSALFCLAMLRCAQWLGSALGQSVSFAVPVGEGSSIVVLIALIVALLLAVDMPSGISSAKTTQGKPKSVSNDARENGIDRVALTVERYRLSPREAEVLGYWASGYPSPFIEKKLFISKSTVKTHLTHIYGKTGTSNRQSLLELLDALEEEARS